MKRMLWAGLAGALGFTLILTACTRSFDKKPTGPASPLSPADTDTPTSTAIVLPDLTATPTDTPGPGYTPTSTGTPTNSPTAIATVPSSPSPSPTSGGTAPVTRTFTPTGSPTMTATATITGCLRTCYWSQPIPTQVTAGTAVTGLLLVGSIGCPMGYCSPSEPLHYVTGMGFSAQVTGNLSTQILGVELWAAGVLVATGPFDSGMMNLTLSTPTERRERFELKLVLSPAASGTYQIKLRGANFGVLYDMYSIGPVVTVVGGSTPTPTETRTHTPTPTKTPTKTPTATFTPTP